MLNIKISMQTLPSQPKIEWVEGMVALWFLIKHSLFCCLFFFLIHSWKKVESKVIFGSKKVIRKEKMLRKYTFFFLFDITMKNMRESKK